MKQILKSGFEVDAIYRYTAFKAGSRRYVKRALNKRIRQESRLAMHRLDTIAL